MQSANQKLNLILGFHSHIPTDPEFIKNNYSGNGLTKKYIDFQNGLMDLLNSFQEIKATFHLTGNLISYLDKRSSGFSGNIRSLLDRNQLELLSGGIYEPIFSFTPKEDRQTQVMLMNRLLNHTYGYTPYGAWITELSWEPSIALDLAKSKIQYTCLPKEYFFHAGLKEDEISGYYLTEEEGRKIAIFPISHELNNLAENNSPDEVINNLLRERAENPFVVLFYKDEDPNLDKVNWLKAFFQLLNRNNEYIETQLFNDYFSNNKPKGRIYLPTMQDAKPGSNSGYWKNFLLKYHEINLLHKKMLRVSKKINSAKEGKSRFKVIKEMINQAHDLLLKGQSNYAYWNSKTGGIYLPHERYSTYSNLIKAENLIDAASRHGSKWIQVYELDYDCDGHDEIIVETETQNVYISPALGGAILEHDFRPKNLNLTNIVSRKEENYHEQNENLLYDNYPKLNLIDHFLDQNTTFEECITNQLKHLTKEIISAYQVEKIKAKEETCKVTFNSNVTLTKLENHPEIELKKQISLRSGESALIYDYTLTNKSIDKIDFTFGIEFNLNISPISIEESYFYLDGDKKNKISLKSQEEIKEVKQISAYNKVPGVDLTFSWNKSCNLFKYPIETFSYNHKNLEKIYQGTTILLTWKLSLEPNIPYELSIKEAISTSSEEI